MRVRLCSSLCSHNAQVFKAQTDKEDEVSKVYDEGDQRLVEAYKEFSKQLELASKGYDPVAVQTQTEYLTAFETARDSA
jgi:hypothetical protein